MQVLVVGGTGTLGRQIARKALDAGHQVRCMVRTPRKASFLQEWGCELTRGDLLEPASLDYPDGVDVIDAATSRPTDPQSVYVTDWDGKLNLIRPVNVRVSDASFFSPARSTPSPGCSPDGHQGLH